ncbi:MAG: pantoate--beta-alanine ligase [Anaerovoracaceae bacterium]|jgi:pantoate--beta-alanine ligase
MKILHTIEETRSLVKEWKRAGESVGLVPTMGALHEGHGSLIKRSCRENDRTVVSVFVNPMQFSRGEDLNTYPRDMDSDSAYCEELGADLIFNPAADEMYPDQFYTFVDMKKITERLCGRSRKNMFRGVCTVCSKLFHIVAPDRAYFGKKDAQQLAVMRQMVKDLNMDLEIVDGECVREADGLAKSSRNSYLTKEERAAAPGIYRALCAAKKTVAGGNGDVDKLIRDFTAAIKEEPLFQLEYVEVVDGKTMQPVGFVPPDGSCIIATAVRVGKARLIDNVEL